MRDLFNRIFNFKCNNIPATAEEKLEKVESVQKCFEEYKRKNLPLGVLDAQELEAWIKHPTTKKMVLVFKKMRLDILHSIGKGFYNKDILPIMIGRCQGISSLINTINNIEGEEHDVRIEEILSLYLFNIFNEEL